MSREVIEKAFEGYEQSVQVKFDKIQRHLAENHSVCHFARLAGQKSDIYFANLDFDRMRDRLLAREFLIGKMSEFFESGKRVMILTFDYDFSTHHLAQYTAKQFFVELAIATQQLMFTEKTADSIERDAYAEHGLALLNPGVPIINPAIKYRDGSNNPLRDLLFVFTGNNLYLPEHPRYLPHAALVINYNEDIIDIFESKPEAAARIQINAMTALACPYIKDVSLKELREESEAKMVYGRDGEALGFSTSLHTAISSGLEEEIARYYKKGLYVLPF